MKYGPKGLWKLAVLCGIVLACPASSAHAQAPKYDWSWVKGAVFVPTNCVNEAQQWDQYDPARNDRELHYASVYGFNCVRVFLHFDIYLKNKQALLDHIEDFLTRADKYGIKVEFIFFDDCWNQPPKEILSKDYQYPAPIYGVHNSQWLQCPGDEVKANYAEYRPQLQAYVQDIVNAHKDDKRIAFWETYNEPNKSAGTIRILKDAVEWIHATGTALPVTATDRGFSGGPYSDFISWHEYGSYKMLGSADTLCTECMNRQGQTVPGIVEHFRGHTGFEMWEFGIGRDNCRFAWGQNRQTPATKENDTPFHGVVYADGHPWSVDDVKAMLGPTAFAKAPLFKVEYFKDDHFGELAKTSVTPMIDFDLPTDRGLNSIDPQAGMPGEHYSVRWTGTIRLPAKAQYHFFVKSDGLIKLRVDTALILTKMRNGIWEGPTLFYSRQPLHKLVLEYVHDTGQTIVHLHWFGPGVSSPAVTAVSSF